VFKSTREKVTANLAGASPDVTLPVNREADGRGPAVLFADVSKSMQLHERLGDAGARVAIDHLLGLAITAVKAQGGRVVKLIGDEILAVLPNADAAARASCDLMLEVECCAPQGGVKLGMHVGFHAGTFIERGGDVFGDAVNIANRLTAYAKSGQILVTTAGATAISPIVRRLMRPMGPLDFEGRREEMQVEEIAWRNGDDEDATITEAMLRASHCASTRLVLRLGTRQWTLSAQVRRLTIGRDPSSDILICATQASRNHGSIEYRNGGFFYGDTSLNGSYVAFGNSGESLIQRSETLLSGQGVISFGQTLNESDDGNDRLEFKVESTEH
jgi:class 3 adenylate cyclase